MALETTVWSDGTDLHPAFTCSGTRDLPADIWAIIKQRLSLSDWAKACGTSATTYALRRPPLIAGEVHGGLGNVYQDMLLQLQLDLWSACQSLWRTLLPTHEAEEDEDKGNNMQGQSNLISQLHLDRWSACHSMYINLWQLHEAMTVTFRPA